ncbi:MAG: tryptophan--tRNA ligase [Firmicutes bacterium]|nr:tryptophan--tRNA ligase [Bacillota bacterium]
MNKTVLTGIKPTGVAHIGNYFGAIRPAIELANATEGPSYLFLADYHSLTTVKDGASLCEYVKDVACTWLACGLDVKRSIFYRQSDVPGIFELAIILANYTAKGLLNRAHAYKSIVQDAIDRGVDPDHNVNVGLFYYPVLQAADILAFDVDLVPVGQDQKQHIEICADIAKSFNAIHGNVLRVPDVIIKKDVATLPGLDGRKMSKSYGNQIPLFCSESELKKYIKKIVTDSSLPTDPKSTDCLIFQIYKLFATESEVETMANRFKQGIGWGTVKEELFLVANRMISPMREKYEYYINNFEEVEKVLIEGAKKARQVSQKTLERVRKVIGAST